MSDARSIPATADWKVGVRFAGRAWGEGALTRADELDALARWAHTDCPAHSEDNGLPEDFRTALDRHLYAARTAALARFPFMRNKRLLQRAMSNLDAAEALILNAASPDYLLGQLPSLLHHVQRHLEPADPRRMQVERVAQLAGIKDQDHPLVGVDSSAGTRTVLAREDGSADPAPVPALDPCAVVSCRRGQIVTAVRGASSEALREQMRLANFRNVLAIATVVMTVLALGIGVMGLANPSMVPMCFEPVDGTGGIVVVCPTDRREVPGGGPTQPPPPPQVVDRIVDETAEQWDIFVIEFVGLAAAAIAAAAAVRRLRGSSEPFAVPVAVALLKLPTGALTAFLGLLLMRGQFVPGLSALDTPAQILAWAIVFGYAQQLFTRFVDQRADSVLNSVRTTNRTTAAP